MIHGRIAKRRFESRTIQDASTTIVNFGTTIETYKNQNNALQQTLTERVNR